MEKQREDEIWCLIAGMVSSGKSRFLNALFPGLSLPVGTLPMTAAPTFLRFGRETVEVTTDRGRTIRERVESLEKYSRKWNTPGEKLRGLEVYLENPILESGLVFVDTPGLGMAGETDDVFLHLLPKADAVFYFLEKGMTQEDQAYLDTIAGQKTKLVVVRAKIDRIHWSEERVEDVLREEERAILDRYPHCRVYFVSLDQEMEEDQLERVRAYIAGSLQEEIKEARRMGLKEAFEEELAARRREIMDRLNQEEEGGGNALRRSRRRRLEEVEEKLDWAKAQIAKAVDEAKGRCRKEGLDALASAYPGGGWPREEEMRFIAREVSALCQWYREYVERVTGRNLLKESFDEILKLPDGAGMPSVEQRSGIWESRQQYKRLVTECFACVKDCIIEDFQTESRRARRDAEREVLLMEEILDKDRQITRANLRRELAAVEEELEILAYGEGDER